MLAGQENRKPEPAGPRGRAGAGERSLRQFAYDRIEDLLNAGRLTPGVVISQRELVELTGATLGSVREAVPRLEAEGLLVTLPQRGLMVPNLEPALIREAYQMRRMIEAGAVPAMVASLPAAEVRGWVDWHRSALETVEQGAEDGGFLDRLQRFDWSMHARMVEALDNRLVANVYRVTAIKIRMAAQSRLQVTPLNARRVIGEHLAFLEPMLRGETEATRDALLAHVDSSLSVALGGKAGR